MSFLAPPEDLLMSLARCSDRRVFLMVVGVRVAFLVYSQLCVYLLPRLFGQPPKFFMFDTGERLYEDKRFAAMGNWDGVHFFHIAKYGYSHENVHVFFPLVPLIIRGVTFLVRDTLPILLRIAPVTFYVTLINVAASGLAAVLLRSLTLLTFMGPEARELVAGAGRVGRVAALRLAIRHRLEHEERSTVLDSSPDVRAIAAAAARPTDVASVEAFTWRMVGATVLLWAVTPSMIFTVAVYTESCFSLFTFAGIYLLARYPSAADGTGVKLFPFPDAASTAPAAGVPHIKWKQAYLSTAEAAAVVCFTMAALSRSNGFLCCGFLLYPTFIRMCFPRLYRLRWSCVHGHYALPQPTAEDGAREAATAVARGERSGECSDGRATAAAGVAAPTTTVRTLHPPHGRVPNPLRLLVLALEVAIILTPYMAVNYHGWKVYTPLWTSEEQAAIGHRFWKFYGVLQKKYWNVGFLSAYTVVNSPNVAVGAPCGLLILCCVYRFYFGGDHLRRLMNHMRRSSRRTTTANGTEERGCTSGDSTEYLTLGDCCEAFMRSSNVVYLLALTGVAYAIMHVQVVNRFLMSCPALYWLMSMQVVSRPRARLSRAILLFSIIWALVGGMLFPNHLPWT